MNRTWTAPDLTEDDLEALRQILSGEYRPWCRDWPNAEERRMKPEPSRHHTRDDINAIFRRP